MADFAQRVASATPEYGGAYANTYAAPSAYETDAAAYAVRCLSCALPVGELSMALPRNGAVGHVVCARFTSVCSGSLRSSVARRHEPGHAPPADC